MPDCARRRRAAQALHRSKEVSARGSRKGYGTRSASREIPPVPAPRAPRSGLRSDPGSRSSACDPARLTIGSELTVSIGPDVVRVRIDRTESGADEPVLYASEL